MASQPPTTIAAEETLHSSHGGGGWEEQYFTANLMAPRNFPSSRLFHSLNSLTTAKALQIQTSTLVSFHTTSIKLPCLEALHTDFEFDSADQNANSRPFKHSRPFK